MRLEHSREDDAMEHDIVLADEVNETSLWVLPPLLPCAPLLRMSIAEFLGVRDISDRSIEPYVEHFALGTLYRHRNTPIEVASHCTWLKIHVEPALALSVHIRAPLLVTFQNPLFEPILIFAQW